MKKIYKLGLLTLAFLLADNFEAKAQTDVFIKWGDGEIRGETQDENYQGWSELLSIELGLENTQDRLISGSTRNSTRAIPKSVNLTKRLDFASADLAALCAKGEVIKGDVTIDFIRISSQQRKVPEVYLKIILKNVSITNYSLSTSSGDDIVEESIELAYREIEYVYRKQQKDGSLGAKKEFKWNFETNKSD